MAGHYQSKSALPSIENPHPDTLSPPPAFFNIPTHATTHALAIESEDLDDEEKDLDRAAAASTSNSALVGRPSPSPIEPVAESSSLGPNLPPSEAQSLLIETALNDGSGTPSVPLHAPQSAQRGWRTAYSILSRNSANTLSSNLAPPLPPLSRSLDPTHAVNETRQIPVKQIASRDQRDYHPRGPPPVPDHSQPAGGRFPRWRGWLERRAVERQQGRLTGTGAEEELDVQRKKSWGAAVDDEDAVSETDENETDGPTLFFPSPLHIHSLGSRFISHIPSLPLCAVSLELPPPTSTAARFLQRTVPESQKRRVLLVGTADGLYAVEIRRESRGDDVVLNDSSARKGKENTRPQQEKGNWNGNVRCFQIWSGVGIYQMSVLAPQPSSGEGKLPLYGFGGRQSVAQESGIFLALCSSKTSSRQQITSTTPVTSLPDLANASSGVSPHSSSHGPRESSSTSLSTANFGREAGGGQGRHVPPSGSGGVRMWSLEAIRRIVTHVLDSAEHYPINLLRTTKTGQKGIHGFTSRFRKAWAIIGDERKFNRPLRHSEGTSMAGTSLSSMAPPMQISYSHEGRSKPSYVSPLQNGHSRSQSEQMLSTVTSWTDHDMMPEDNPGDFAHQEALRLSQQWVPIYLPGGGSQQSSLGHGSNNSHSSLAVDETLSGVRPGSLGSSTSMHSSGLHGKGILFYALTQANSDLHRSETWYLALVQSKSILLFESTSPSARGAARSWNFVKEFYTPMQPRGVSFCFSDSTDVDGNDHKSTTSTSTRRSSMRRSAMNMHKSVNFSSYSSVFRTNATLHLFVSLGKKAVIIRASDGYVREVDPQPPAQSWSTDSDAGHIGKHASASESSAPASKASSHGHSHSRWSLTMDMLDATNPKDAWTGLETVNAQVAIRCIPSGLMNEENQGDDDDDDDDEWDSDENAGTAHPGITLRDTSAGVPRSSLLRRPRKIQIPTHTVLAGVYILSHGFVSQILPSPLSRDTFHSRPLCSIQWPSVPTAVTATARVIGLERGLSSGPVSIDSLNRSRQQHGSLSDTSKTNEVILHLRIAVLAFLPSRIELRRVRVRVPVRLPFAYTRDTELELESAGASDLLSATAVVSQKDNDVRHGAGSEAHDDDASVHDELESDQSQELEYLCGMLCATSHEGKDTKPWEAAGDGGAWAFDWRGANDFRIFYAGAHV